ncbi:unnamed protein product [Periconia digitata]|uniref:Enoyl reductase (ER) domain-containing protein n=1 Tax=Periconia digitata TaxID=1303443 RepID=A0A9W4XL07_9PLEO|nr:unnamed protein product [Periconia digitata]
MSQPVNAAAYLTTPSSPLAVKPAPYTPARSNELVIKTHAIALNWFDVVVQHMSSNVTPWLKHPFIPGSDVAGEVVEVGSSVTRFKPGDRVLGHAAGTDKRSNRACEGAFQSYVVLQQDLTSKIPNSLEYERACMVPLTLSTAACGLYLPDLLNLTHPASFSLSQTPPPQSSSPHPEPTDKPFTEKPILLIWGAATTVGTSALQLALASNYTVYTTSSPASYPLLRALGATKTFDYASPTAVPDIIAAMRGKPSAGALAIGPASTQKCIPIVAASTGRKFIAQASVPTPDSMPPKGFAMAKFIAKYLWFSVSTKLSCLVNGVGVKFIWGSDVVGCELGKMVYAGFLEGALERGEFVVRPEARVVGEGLEALDAALDVVRQGGLRAEKIVVKI